MDNFFKFVMAWCAIVILGLFVAIAVRSGMISVDLGVGILQVLGSIFPIFLLFCLLKIISRDPGKRQTESDYIWVLIISWGFIACIVVYFYLLFRFNLFGWWGLFPARALCLLLPGVAYMLLRPLYRCYIHTDRMDADRIASTAFEHKPFADFVTVAGKVRIFATDTEKQYRHARVHALHRFTHPLEPPVIQDTVFEVQVDMRWKRAVKGSEVFQTYLFRPEEEKCPVLVLPMQLEDWHPGDPSAVDKVSVLKLEGMPERFLNLHRYPLPIASRNKEAVELPWAGCGLFSDFMDRDQAC
ncbi:MAG TPA: hypothetical protein PLQ35_00930 [bacterium]|nr:hypothetical protein [bacterium]HQL60834.1 hypothetical protein [bacterium]